MSGIFFSRGRSLFWARTRSPVVKLVELAEETSSSRGSVVKEWDGPGNVSLLHASYHSHSEENKSGHRVLQNWQQRLCFNITFQYFV